MRILIAVLSIAFVLLLVAVALLNHEERVRLNLGEGAGRERQALNPAAGAEHHFLVPEPAQSGACAVVVDVLDLVAVDPREQHAIFHRLQIAREQRGVQVVAAEKHQVATGRRQVRVDGTSGAADEDLGLSGGLVVAVNPRAVRG